MDRYVRANQGPVARASRGYAKVTHGTHLVALVRAGAEFENGKLVERPAESGGDAQAA
jgi:hypothetical protein